jgi:hypothetical protein
MNLIVYDCEVFREDWLIVFKDHATGKYTVVHNDNEALKACLDTENIYIGFNSKFYDQFIIKAIWLDMSPGEVKEINDYLIKGGMGWEHPVLRDSFFAFNNVDLMDDMQMGLSLKAIEGHLFMNIKESDVDFNIDRPLTAEELVLTEKYCKHDVDATEEILKLRGDYLKNKIHIGKLAGVDEVKAMGMTNAKLTAALLKASPQKHNDEREYVIPDNLRREYIPEEVFEFFARMKNPDIPDKELFSEKLDIKIGECPVRLAYGGIHGAIPNYIWEESDDGRINRNKDVASYYPHLMTINGYISRNIPSSEIFEEVLETRMKAKAAGDKATANALKLVVNTTYGATLNKYNNLFDPLMGRSVCISGQLYLLELSEHLYKEIPDLKIVQVNTDGIMVEFHKDYYPMFDEITKEWEQRTGFELEEDSVKKIAQKDVNNYIEIQTNGEIKTKGGYLVKGIAKAGAFNINNNAVIVATALKEYLANGTPVEKTVEECEDISQFQMIAKAGTKYREAYHLVDGKQEPVQKVNRVYATKDERYGKLFKVKAEDDSTAKIDSLPEHCIIDNENHLTIKDIDKSFYIEMARKRVNDFKGIKPEKQTTRRKKEMATATKTTTKSTATKTEETKNLNVFQKLLQARKMFLEEGVSKSGKNPTIKYLYFELDDIVPTATKIFSEVGLIGLVSFSEEQATMTLVNTDNPEETILFTTPMRYPSENKAVNPVQALGAAQTYLRRYLYMVTLDICEADSIEPTTEADTPQTTSHAPATTEEREEVKEELTAPKGGASELQIKQLKGALKQLLEAQPDKEEFVSKVALQTDSFTNISKEDCEKLLVKISELLEGDK